MPRAQPTAGGSSTPSTQTASQLLKRNHACHQCRRRKLKCDTQRPCTTCVKSHRYAANSNTALLGTEPECTYDPVTSDGTLAVKPQTKYKVLEDRIGELEALLKAQSRQQPGPASENLAAFVDASFVSEPSISLSPSEFSEDNVSQYLPTISESLLSFEAQPVAHTPRPTLSAHPLLGHPPQAPDYTPNISERQVIWTDWPPRLPPPDLLHHLVEVFFSCYAHAHYLLHRPTFTASLSVSPKSPKFPHVSLLHAICAYASIFSYLVDSPPMPNLDKANGDVIFGDRRNVPGDATESFADRHARWSKETREEATALGFNLMECTQSIVVITGFYHLQGRWVELWMSAGQVLRYCIPLTLNNREGYHTDGTATTSVDEASLLLGPSNCVEREQRVNLFWVAYANERFQTTPGAWAMGLDDEDVHQVLPYSVSYYEAGLDVEEPRQTIGTPDMLLTHPQTVDSFTLYVKAAILMSKVKTLNLRIRHQYPNATDLRELPTFQQLEKQVMLFRNSFPQQYHEPVAQSSRGLDAHLYVAHLVPNYTMLALHEKLADVCSPNCPSTQKAMEAARGTLELVHAVYSTSYDVTRLAPICALCWYKAASFMVRMLKVELSGGHYAEAANIDSEIRTIQLAFSRMAQRIPLALRYMKMIDDEIKDGGRNRSQSVQSASYEQTYTPHLAVGRSLAGANTNAGWMTPQPNTTWVDDNTLRDSMFLPPDMTSMSAGELDHLFDFSPPSMPNE